uniref:C-type lectin domain-containing protein n=1 Tax=Hucho hucho TaxID=62062 RepID=A0A4W5RDV2_9TELE
MISLTIDPKVFQGSCSMGWYSSNGRCFKYIAMLSQKSPTWIGLSDTHKEGRWMWSDGSQVDFWNGEQPDNDQDTEDCVLPIWPGGMQWNDLTCSNLFAFVCAKRPN